MWYSSKSWQPKNKWYSSNVFLQVGHKGSMDLSILHLLAGRRLWPVLSWNISLAEGASVLFCKRLRCFKETLLISGTIFLYLACDCLAHLMPQISIGWFLFAFLAVDIVNCFVWWCLLAGFTPTLASLSASLLNLRLIREKTCVIAKFSVLNSLLILLISSIMSLNDSSCFVVLSLELKTYYLWKYVFYWNIVSGCACDHWFRFYFKITNICYSCFSNFY